jgi:ribosomal protein L12E/L44/L45/RPP1/RPP2
MNLGYNTIYKFSGRICGWPACDNMTKADIFKLTLALYRVTALFPKKEPLRFALRHRALKIFSSLSLSEQSSSLLSQTEKANALKNDLIYLDNLKSLFRLAKEQEWVDNRNFAALEGEYQRLEEILRRHFRELTAIKQIAAPESGNEKKADRPSKIFTGKKEKEEEREDKEIKASFFDDPEEMPVLEKKILKTLKEKGKMKRSEIEGFFPGQGIRSLQRKLNGLKNRNLLEAAREGRDTFYFHKS